MIGRTNDRMQIPVAYLRVKFTSQCRTRAFRKKMHSIMDVCILIVVCTVAVCVFQILFLYVIERLSRNLTSSKLNGNRQDGDEQSERERIPRGRRQPVEQEEWHVFGMLVFLEYFQLTPCLYCYLKLYLYANQLRVYTPITTWWMLVRFVLSFFLFGLVFFVLFGTGERFRFKRPSAILNFFHISKLQKCRGLV